MYRARRLMQPKIPLTAQEFSQVLPGSGFDQHHNFTASIENNTAVVLASQKMVNLLTEVIHIQFDGTFYNVPLQFLSNMGNICHCRNKVFYPNPLSDASKDQRLYKPILLY